MRQRKRKTDRKYGQDGANYRHFNSNKEDKWLRGKRKWMSFLTPGHMQCMCALGCVRVSSLVKSLNADLHCRVRRVPAVSRPRNGCAVYKKALKAERKALKALLTPVSSADHHLVPVLLVLLSYRTVLHPCLSESSKRCWVKD